jgi:hypothetical protein
MAMHWAAKNNLPRGRRSASRPPSNPNSSTGINAQNDTTPSMKLECVKR